MADHPGFYRKLRQKAVYRGRTPEQGSNRIVEFLFIIPDVFYLILKLLRDPAMPFKNKLKLGIALIYFLSPLDFIPAFILGPLGLTDDIVVSAFVMNILFNQTDYQLILRNWPGKEANLIVARRLIQSAGQWLGKGFLGKLRAVFSITRK